MYLATTDAAGYFLAQIRHFNYQNYLVRVVGADLVVLGASVEFCLHCLKVNMYKQLLTSFVFFADHRALALPQFST